MGTPSNRTVRLQFRLNGTLNDLAARVAEIEAVMEAMRRRGGTITRRAHGQTYRQHFAVLTTNGLQAGEWAPVADTRYILSPILEFTCAPYALGDPMAWTDDAAAILDNTDVAAGAGVPVIAGDLLTVPASGEHLLVDSLRGYRYGDVQVSTRLWPGAATGGDRRWGVLLRYVDPDNWLAVTVEQVAAAGGIQHPGQRAGLGLDAGKLGLGLLHRRAGGVLGLARRFHRLLGVLGCSFGLLQRGNGLLRQQPLLGRIGKGGDAGADLGEIAVDLGKLAREAVAPLGGVAQAALDLGARGGGFRPLGGEPGQRLLARRKRRGGGLEGGAGGGLALGGAGILLVQRSLFLGQPLQHVRVLAHHALLAGNVGVELLQAAVELALPRTDAGGLLLDLRAGDGKALEGGGRRSLRLAQLRQLVRADGLRLGCLHLHGRALAHQRGGGSQRRARLALCLLGLHPGMCRSALGFGMSADSS